MGRAQYRPGSAATGQRYRGRSIGGRRRHWPPHAFGRSPPACSIARSCQSFCLAFTLPTKGGGRGQGVAFAEEAGCGSGAGPEVAQCLRNLTAAKVEEARRHGKHAGQIHMAEVW